MPSLLNYRKGCRCNDCTAHNREAMNRYLANRRKRANDANSEQGQHMNSNVA